MSDVKEYCHYILSLDNRKSVYATVPARYKTKQDILSDFDENFKYNPRRCPGFNKWLVDTLWWALEDSELIQTSKLSGDVGFIYKRCIDRMPQIDTKRRDDGYVINYQDIFEILSDFIWILISQRCCGKERKSTIQLIDNFSIIHIKIRQVYINMEQKRGQDAEEVSVIEKALRLKKKFFSITSDERVRRYLESGMRYEEIQGLLDEKKRQVEHDDYLFFALMATSVRYEEVRRVLL